MPVFCVFFTRIIGVNSQWENPDCAYKFQKLRFFSAQKVLFNSSQINELENRPLPSSKNPPFQNEARCTTFLVKMSFICMRIENDLHIKGWAPTLVLKQRPGGTRKWTIGTLKVSGVPNSIGCRDVSVATLKCGNHPSERPLTGTGTLK